MGSPVGLFDHDNLSDALAAAYTYKETGYNASVACVCNRSDQFLLNRVGKGLSMFWVPNSAPGNGEYSTYCRFERRCDSRYRRQPRHAGKQKFFGLADGSSYTNLSIRQCNITCTTTAFQVFVGLGWRNITVGPSTSSTTGNTVISFETGNLKQTISSTYLPGSLSSLLTLKQTYTPLSWASRLIQAPQMT